jgi:hypothetical protein
MIYRTNDHILYHEESHVHIHQIFQSYSKIQNIINNGKYKENYLLDTKNHDYIKGIKANLTFS